MLMYTALLATATILLSVAAEARNFLEPAWTTKLPYGPAASPAAAIAGNTYFVEDINGTVWAIDLRTHNVVWSLMWRDVESLVPFADHDVLLVQLQEGTWCVRASTGEFLWANNTIQPLDNYRVLDAGAFFVVYVYDAANRTTLTAYNIQTGAVHWTLQAAQVVEARTWNSILVTGENTGNIVGRDVVNKTTVWERPFDFLIGLINGHVFAARFNANASQCTFGCFDISILDASSGAELAHFPGLTRNYPILISRTRQGNVLLSDTYFDLVLLDGTSFKLLWKVGHAIIHPNIASLVDGSHQIIAFSSPGLTQMIQLFNITALNPNTGAVSWVIQQPPTVATGSASVMLLCSVIIVPNLVGFIAFNESTGSIIHKDFEGTSPFVPGTQRVVSSNPRQVVTQGADGSVMFFSCEE